MTGCTSKRPYSKAKFLKIDNELADQNERLLKGIETRQDNLNTLSKYLSELESQLSLIFAASPDIIVFLDKNSNIVKITFQYMNIPCIKKRKTFRSTYTNQHNFNHLSITIKILIRT